MNKMKKVNSFITTKKTKMNSIKQNKISKNNSQYIFPMVNNNINDIKKNIKENKNSNLTLEINQKYERNL